MEIHIHINQNPRAWKVNPVSNQARTDLKLESGSPEKKARALNPVRHQINRLVCCIASRDDTEHAQVFREIYDRYERKHGHHPIIESFRTGHSVHLDWVERQPGGMERLLAIVEVFMLELDRKVQPELDLA